MKKHILLKTLTMVLAVSLLFTLSAFATTQNVTPKLEIYAQTLELESNVYINYYVDVQNLTDPNSVELLIWTNPQASNTTSPYTNSPDYKLTPVSTNATLSDQSTEASYVKYSFRELAAKQMTDTVYARAHVEIDGEHYYSDVQKYSILQYAYNKLGKTDSVATKDEALKGLLNSLLAYGASAQIYFDYQTERLATNSFYQIKVVDGVISEDGCNNGLYLANQSVTLTTTAPDAERTHFVGWLQNSKLTFMGTNTSLTVTTDTKNETYTAIWASEKVASINSTTTINQNIVVSGSETDAISVMSGTAFIEGGYYNGGQTPLGDAGNTAVWANGGNVVINDGYFTINGLADGDTGHIDLIYAKLGTITINGGFFVGENDTVWLLNCNDTNYKNGTANIIVKGGTFVNFDPSNNAFEGEGTSFVADGYTVIKEIQDNGDVWYTVIPEN